MKRIRETRYRTSVGRGAAIDVRFVTYGRAVIAYAVVLLARTDGTLCTVRVYDNAHGVHDMHRYNRAGEKQSAERFHRGSPGEAMRSAQDAIKSGYREMIRAWRA